MTQQLEAMKLALEALENEKALNEGVGVVVDATNEAITFLRQAIEQAQKQEPVAWLRTSGTGSPVVTEDFLRHRPEFRCEFRTPLYTSPPQRQWVGLTDEDVRQCSKDVADEGKENCVDRFAQAIEAKLKEKNT